MNDKQLAHVTTDAIAVALAGFSMPFADGWDNQRLSAIIRLALGFSIPIRSNEPERMSEAEIRNELVRLADRAEALFGQIYSRPHDVDHWLFNHSLRRSGVRNRLAAMMGRAKHRDYDRIGIALKSITLLSEYFRDAAAHAGKQPPNWRSKESKEIRISRGALLAPIYESAFGEKISVNGWPSDPRFVEPTPYMEFYRRVMKMAFGEDASANIAANLKAAARQHKQDPHILDWLINAHE